MAKKIKLDFDALDKVDRFADNEAERVIVKAVIIALREILEEVGDFGPKYVNEVTIELCDTMGREEPMTLVHDDVKSGVIYLALLVLLASLMGFPIELRKQPENDETGKADHEGGETPPVVRQH